MATKILVVDDEEDVAELLEQRFRHKIKDGTYDFRFASSGQQALTRMQAEPDFDVLLLDINMPDINGLTLLGRLPELMPHSRAVIVSAYGDMDNIRTAMNRGAFDFVCKPINFLDLDATIEKTAQHVQQLREAAQVKLMAALKTQFFDNITHEFRTPLTLILAPVAGLLQDARLPDDARHDLLTVERNARQLLYLINQLLEMARLEAGQLRVEARPGPLADYLQELAEGFQALARQRGIQLRYQASLPGQWLYDAEKVAHITYNLLANALKFMPPLPAAPGTPREVTVALAPGGSGVQLTVSDTGIGIAAANLPRIFDRFYQATPGATQLPVGAGIGLALVRELTTLMGGQVRVQSRTTPPTGSTFTVELPLLPAAAGLPLAPVLPTPDWLPAPVPVPPFAGLTAGPAPEAPLVVLIEDNEDLRTYLARQLAPHYRILTAANGEEGWQLISQELPEVVVSDVMMPELDGYELTYRIKNTPATDHIAVVLLTAQGTQDQRLTGLRQGADEYLTKPFHLEELSLRLHNLLVRQQRLRTLYGQQLSRPELAQPTETVQNGWLQTLYAVLENQLDSPELSVESLADRMAMSRKTLLRKVQALTQLAPSELIQQYRLRKAADLLRAGHSVADTAYAVGFNTPAYFGQCFKDLYQVTPSEFSAAATARPQPS